MLRETSEEAKASRLRGTRSDGKKRIFAVYGTWPWYNLRHCAARVTAPRATAGNKAVRGMNGLSQLPAILCSKRRGSVTSRTLVGYRHGVETHLSLHYLLAKCCPVSLNSSSVLQVDFQAHGRAVNVDQYCATLKGLREVLRMKRSVFLPTE